MNLKTKEAENVWLKDIDFNKVLELWGIKMLV